MKKIFVSEDSLRKIKENIKANDKNVSLNTVLPEDKPLAEKDKFVIGAEGGNNDYFHINESAHADLNVIGSISYTVDEKYTYDEEDHKHWWDFYDTEEEYLQACAKYDGETYDRDGHHIDFFDGDKYDIEYYFQDNLNIAELIINKKGDFRNDEYWITDIQEEYMNDPNISINDVESVNNAAKRYSSPSGPSRFILTDGDEIGFHDHSQIQNVCDGLTISKFLELGNIRLGGNDCITIELIKKPTYYQKHRLKSILSYSSEAYIDFAKPNSNDNMYPEVIYGVHVRVDNPDYIVNSIDRYFDEGIKMVSESKEGVKENIESEVEASEVKLDSFKKNDILAPKIWNGSELNPRVRLKLLDIADDFWDFTTVTWAKRSGIHLTGSICNFNWSKFSDIDLHIIVDFSKIDDRTDFVQEYFNAKKNEWNDEHSNLKIYGYPVELYVEDINAETTSDGLYDLEENKWIKIPNKDSFKSIKLDKYDIKSTSAKLMTKIDDLTDEFNNTDDDAQLRDIGKRAHKLLNKIKRMRKYGLDRGGESDTFNIVYKVLRRSGYLDNLWDLSSKLYDKINSIGINEDVETNQKIDYFTLAKERFGITNDIRECGFILPDGTMLDFSGRHQMNKGSDTSFLRGRRSIDHREIKDIGWSEDMNTKNFDFRMEEFIRMGAIRVHVSNMYSTVNLFTIPTNKQIAILKQIIRYSKGCVEVEIGDGDESLSYAEYDEVNPNRVTNDILRYFNDGINLIGNVNEERVIYEYYKKLIPMNEEVVADSSADSNPFKKRWERERQALKDYLVNYGEIMTSKENGKQYKVLYDTMLSQRLGINFCICIQWNQLTMEPGNVIYVRAYDKFTKRLFRPQFDTRGYDNLQGTSDDVV